MDSFAFCTINFGAAVGRATVGSDVCSREGGMFSAVLQLMPSQSFLLGMSSLAVFYAPQARKRGGGKKTDKGKICSPLLLLRFPSQTSLPTTPKTIAHVNNTVGRIFCLLFSPRPFKQILPPRPFTSIGKRKEERVSRRVGVVDRGKNRLFLFCTQRTVEPG